MSSWVVNLRPLFFLSSFPSFLPPPFYCHDLNSPSEDKRCVDPLKGLLKFWHYFPLKEVSNRSLDNCGNSLTNTTVYFQPKGRERKVKVRGGRGERIVCLFTWMRRERVLRFDTSNPTVTLQDGSNTGKILVLKRFEWREPRLRFDSCWFSPRSVIETLPHQFVVTFVFYDPKSGNWQTKWRTEGIIIMISQNLPETSIVE